MITLRLASQSEKVAPENPWDLKHHPLYHQMRTYEALRNHKLVVNTYNTGTGKTIASLLYLFDLAKPDRPERNVLFIAPTNALLHQHAQDIREFTKEHDLDFLVLEVDAAWLRQIMEEGDRPGETLQRLIQNPLTYADKLKEQGVLPDGYRKQPLVLVLNPDIFYYALYFRYGSFDQRNMFEKILSAFNYIVIDEFHYYDSKQLANFLFFFVISQQFGYFDMRGRRICLLSATPNEYVLEYLGRVFDKDDWVVISPDNEPPESAAYASEPVLTALDLDVVETEMQDWVGHHKNDLAGWLDVGQDGALISSALWRINTCFTTLRRTIKEEQLGRITGPESEEDRQRATARPLILATPTVDIGYNFAKLDKPRQNIDFLVCDARYGDELLQRVGRAGRVLGKPEQSETSHAVALLDEAACRALAEYDGETLSRAEFAGIVQNIEALPPKQTLYAYIRTHAITECFYPIYRLGYIMPDDQQEEMDALYERLRDVFTPNSGLQAKSLRGYFHKYWKRQQWLRDTKKEMPLDHETAIQVADWVKWLENIEYEPHVLEPYLEDYLEYERERQRLRAFVASQIHLAESLFSFRDSFQGAMAVVYDQRHLLSSGTINSYSLMHVVSNYRVQWLDSDYEFTRAYGKPEQPGDLYGVIRDWREPRLSLGLVYESPWPRSEFDKRVCRKPIALKGLRLEAKEQGGDIYPLDTRIAGVLADRYVTLMGVTPEDGGVVYGKLSGTTIYPRRLGVLFPDGSIDDGYYVLLGTQAFQAHAELQGYFWMKERLDKDAIII